MINFKSFHIQCPQPCGMQHQGQFETNLHFTRCANCDREYKISWSNPSEYEVISPNYDPLNNYDKKVICPQCLPYTANEPQEIGILPYGEKCDECSNKESTEPLRIDLSPITSKGSGLSTKEELCTATPANLETEDSTSNQKERVMATRRVLRTQPSQTKTANQNQNQIQRNYP